jgi:hypothetical protein
MVGREDEGWCCGRGFVNFFFFFFFVLLLWCGVLLHGMFNTLLTSCNIYIHTPFLLVLQKEIWFSMLHAIKKSIEIGGEDYE